jgi:glycosyltransferase involved in cell wall biosynthesis
MAEALILCPEAPYPVIGGGPMRTACMVEYLASRYSLDVIVFREPNAPDPRDTFPPGLVRKIYVIDLPAHSKSPASRAFRNLDRMRRDAPPLIDRFAGFHLPISRTYDVAVVEHFWCATYADALRPHCRRLVLDLHNIESVLLERCAATEALAGRFALRRFSSACRRLESKLLPRFDLLLVTSEADRTRVNRGFVWPNTMPLVPRPKVPKSHEIAFSGNMEYHPNTAAAHFFAESVWPILRAREPELVWRLIGKNPHILRLPVDSRIHVTGAVEDALPLIAGAKAAVVPLLSGSGTRFKILESWAAGTPVISTMIGAEGLDAVPNEHLLIADDPSQFAAAVLSVLYQNGLASRLAEAGRDLYESRFTWPVAWKVLEAAGL